MGGEKGWLLIRVSSWSWWWGDGRVLDSGENWELGRAAVRYRLPLMA